MSAVPKRAKAVSVSILRRFDLELRRYRHSLRAKRAQILAEGKVDLVLDVGANTGQYARELRATGYRGRIMSFEPLSVAFTQLRRHMVRDPRWDGVQLAIGEVDGSVTMNIAANSVSSSALPMMKRHEEAAPQSAYIGTCDVPMARLDSIRSSILSDSERVHLKLDVQGYEMKVINGATSTLSHVVSVESELSLVPLYEGQVLMSGIVDSLQAADFQLVWIERGFLDPRTDDMLQLDGLFVKHRIAEDSSLSRRP